MNEEVRVFSCQHSPFVRIGVNYEKSNKEAGLVVSVYRTGNGGISIGNPERYRYWNPAEVTKWFETNSKANVESWRAAYHKSGLNADSFIRPSPDGEAKKQSGDVLIEVAYRNIQWKNQRDNKRFPSGSCNVTSCAMPMHFAGVPTLENRYQQYEDNLEYWMAKKGLDRHNHADLETMMRAHGMNSRMRFGVTLDELTDNLRKGIICVVSGAFTSSGHIVCFIGAKGQDYVVHDPFGDWNYRYKSGHRNGAFRIYKRRDMQEVLIDKRKGKGPIWVHEIKGVFDKSAFKGGEGG